MPSKRQIVELLKRDELLAVVDQFGLEPPDRRGKDGLVNTVTSSRKATLNEILVIFKRATLKELCRGLGLDTSGKKKQSLVDRLTGVSAVAKSSFSLKHPPKPEPKPESKQKAKNEKGFEESLWDSANRLRGSVESSEYKHVVLSLIFLKFVSDKFEERRAELVAEGKEQYSDMVEFYTMNNVFYLPKTSRWSYIQKHAKQGDIAIKIDSALTAVEKSNASLKGALPDNYFSRLGLDGSKLSALIDAINNIDTVKDKEEDLVGRVYEYFLGKFAASEGKLGGEFYTPKCVVNLIAEMIAPFKGKIYDPCCGSGGMFVQSLKFVRSHHGNTKDIAVYGQEFTSTTYKLAKMNLAVRGLSANLGDVPADTFFKDQHPDLKADYIMANPPFNLKEWRAADELVHDSRWSGYETPPTGNANYAWILHMVSKLSENGVAGFVLANGSMSTSTSGEGAIRQKLVENDIVDCMIALPGQLFYTTQIPVCLWFLTKNKKAHKGLGYRNREGETLFIDARKIGSMISRTQKEFTADDIASIAQTFHAWRGETPPLKKLTLDLSSSGSDL
jgi:type I restriction enzyme M protein